MPGILVPVNEKHVVTSAKAPENTAQSITSSIIGSIIASAIMIIFIIGTSARMCNMLTMNSTIVIIRSTHNIPDIGAITVANDAPINGIAPTNMNITTIGNPPNIIAPVTKIIASGAHVGATNVAPISIPRPIPIVIRSLNSPCSFKSIPSMNFKNMNPTAPKKTNKPLKSAIFF